MTSHSPQRTCAVLTGAAAALALMLSGCAGSLATASSDDGGGAGFDLDAPQSEVDALLADLEPVTLTYQPAATSPDSTGAASANWFKEQVEERSGGKITIDIVWGQAIASYAEIDDALLDGRVDIAYTAPIYDPAAYPVFQAYSAITQLSPPSPMVGEMASSAMLTELAWNDPDVLAEFTDKGLVPLSPFVSGGDYYWACNSQSPGTSADDIQGRQVRIGGTVHERIAESIGASPVSMEYGETFEALQRNTINCTFGQLGVAALGVYEVAPNISYLDGEQSFAGRVGSAHVGGSDFAALPLAYRQIIFDAERGFSSGWIRNTIDTKAMALDDARSHDGEVAPIDPDVQEAIYAAQDEIRSEALDDGLLPDGVEDSAVELHETWLERVEELGYADGGDFSSLDDWYASGDVDFDPYADLVYREAVLPHRPN